MLFLEDSKFAFEIIFPRLFISFDFPSVLPITIYFFVIVVVISFTCLLFRAELPWLIFFFHRESFILCWLVITEFDTRLRTSAAFQTATYARDLCALALLEDLGSDRAHCKEVGNSIFKNVEHPKGFIRYGRQPCTYFRIKATVH